MDPAVPPPRPSRLAAPLPGTAAACPGIYSIPISEEQTSLSGGKSAKDGLTQEPVAPLWCFSPTSPTMCTVNSSDTTWLLRLKCPRPARECDQQRPWQRFPSAPAEGGTANTLDCSRHFRKKNNTKDWLTQKDFCHGKAAPDESQDTIASAQCILERENYFVRGYVALEVYDPSEYDPFFLKTRTDCWKVSIPTLQDPLLKDTQRKFIETGIIKQCETGRPCSTRELNELHKAELPLLPLSRQHIDAVEWLKLPHAYIASEVHQTKRQKGIGHHKDSERRWCHLSSS
ncbi:protein FAM228B isoform X3 [Phalacrocorax aristotelis]|uniref:protein FAM228B isoform X3 n=1 Tax=Phalacrocorax aristotelis TaxID=126867 RepID=UPI003F4B1780